MCRNNDSGRGWQVYEIGIHWGGDVAGTPAVRVRPVGPAEHGEFKRRGPENFPTSAPTEVRHSVEGEGSLERSCVGRGWCRDSAERAHGSRYAFGIVGVVRRQSKLNTSSSQFNPPEGMQAENVNHRPCSRGEAFHPSRRAGRNKHTANLYMLKNLRRGTISPAVQSLAAPGFPLTGGPPGWTGWR